MLSATAMSSWVRPRRLRKNFMLLLKNIFLVFEKNDYIIVGKMIKISSNIIQKI